MREPVSRLLGRWRAVNRPPSDEGAVAVEFALVVPLFLLLIFGTMVFAFYFATYVAVIHGANEGARASVGGINDAERGTLAAARVRYVFSGYTPLLDPLHAVIATQPGATGYYKVTVSYPISEFGFGVFYTLLGAVSGQPTTAPTTVGYSVIVANGGY